MKIRAPGKLILSGEHAAVYQQPILALAINRYTEVSVQPRFLPGILFDFDDLRFQKILSLSILKQLKDRIQRKYERFVRGEIPIRDVLKKPIELAQIAMSLFFEISPIQLTNGIKVKLASSIPIGCGMGSSAATILSVLYAVAEHLEMRLSPDRLFQLGLKAENMQHGYSSGVDLQASLHGGCFYYHEKQRQVRATPSFPFYLVNTGTPATQTGECVMAAAPYFKTSTLAADFGAVTHQMDAALQANNVGDLLLAMRENHRLLTHIGVVPPKVQDFIQTIALAGGAAKICGAGAVSGEQAGIVWVMLEDIFLLQRLCEQFQFSFFSVTAENRGVHVI